MSGFSNARIGVVGATGAVGREALLILAQRGHSRERIAAFASDRSGGIRLPYGDGWVEVEALAPVRLRDCDGAVFCASAEVSRRWARDAAEMGVVTIDNSAAFRLEEGVPLIVPEVNGESLGARAQLVASPNCSAILMTTALDPLRRGWGIERVIVSTYQAASGAGRAAVEELERETRAALEGRRPRPLVFPTTCAFNVFPHESPVDPDTGMNVEEAKIIAETRKIWGHPELEIHPTCVRVPVFRAHSQSIVVETGRPARAEDVRAALASAEGISLIDAPREGRFPTPVGASGQDHVHVGRVRVDRGGRRIGLWVCGDQLRKGAALNALQILSRLLGRAGDRVGEGASIGVGRAGAAG